MTRQLTARERRSVTQIDELLKRLADETSLCEATDEECPGHIVGGMEIDSATGIVSMCIADAHELSVMIVEAMRPDGADLRPAKLVPPDVVGAIAVQLERRRRALGITQRGLATAAARTQSQINSLLSGRYADVRVSSVVRVANAMDCDVVFKLVPREENDHLPSE